MKSIQFCVAEKLLREERRQIYTHTHSEIEIILYKTAQGKTKIGDAVYNISNNSCAIIHSNIPHSENHQKDCKNILIRFSAEDFEIPSGVYDFFDTVKLEKILSQIYKESHSPRYAYKNLINLKIEELYITMMRDIFSQKYNQSLNDFKQYIDENCHLDISIQSVCESFGFSYNSLRQKFKKYYDISPQNYIILKRLQKAWDMLETTQKSCTEIASECGFSDASQFSKLFKREFGLSPQHYKKIYTKT